MRRLNASRPRHGRSAVAILALALCAVAPVKAVAAPTAPAWSIAAIPFPSAFEPGTAYDSDQAGPGYQIQAYNVGGAPSEGPFTITDSLPPGLRPAPGFPPFGYYGAEGLGAELSCSALGRTISCTGGTETDVGPGEQVSLVVPVQVEASASGTLLDKATIEGGNAAVDLAVTPARVVSGPVPFGLLEGSAGPFGLLTDSSGAAATQAGSHPYQATVAAMAFATNPNDPGRSELVAAGGGVHEVAAELPRGFYADPRAVPRCREAELHSAADGCPLDTQVGTIALTLSYGLGLGSGAQMQPLYNMVPPPGYPAALGFEVIEGTYVHLLASVSGDGAYTISAKSADILARVAVGGVRPVLWGVPSDASHDGQRGECLHPTGSSTACPVERTGRAFVTMPSACSGPLVTTVKADSWLQPGDFREGSYESTDAEGNPVGVDGCNALEFQPAIEARPTTDRGDSPAGLDFELHQPQHEGAGELATAGLRDTTVKLPAGVALNPSAAAGRQGCSSAQIGLASAIGASPVRYREEPQHCPDAAKLGTVEVSTPLLEEKLEGAVYLATPFDNPFDSLLAIYLAVEDEQTGIVAKLAGRVEADPVTGQLRTTFAESPQLPLEDISLHLFKGARAPLTTPLECGTHTITSTLVPWSSPQGADAHPSDSFQTAGGCSASAAAAPKDLSFAAGTADPLAGAYSPFVMKLSRPDGSQRLESVDLTLPPGLTGKLAGLQIGSEVGTVDAAAGSGPNPFHVRGHAYLDGPYKGAPVSLAIVVPAVAGPFDLGVVEVRVALYVDPETAQIHAVSDPLPQILEGIPLDVRSVVLRTTRSEFTLNPTSCEAMSLTGTVGSPGGQSTGVSNRFQVGGCGALPFKPKLKIRLKGATKRTGHPKLIASVRAGAGEAGIARAQVKLPRSAFLDQAHIRTVCTRVQFSASACPKGSIYGHAWAKSPLLGYTLSGPVYLRSSNHKLPDLVVALRGPDYQPIEIDLHGKTDAVKGALRNTFEGVPDAPVSAFRLVLFGGKRGLVVNSRNLCAHRQRANARLRAHSGRVRQLHPLVRASCKKAKSRRHGKHRR